ncbi:MAG: hypothetical protein ABIS29_05585, partial [Vicinamibacterales bacterium]
MNQPGRPLLGVRPFAIAVALAACSLPGAFAQSPSIALEGPTSVEIADTSAPRIARLAVKPIATAIQPADEPKVVEFGLGDLRYDTDKSALGASWELGGDKKPLALILTLNDTV